ncbi:hypothetical protein D3C71_1610500 [compost metagenome]
MTRIVRVQHPLEDQLPIPTTLDPLDHVPVHSELELLHLPSGKGSDVGDTFSMADHVAEPASLRPRHVQTPSGMARHVNPMTQREAGWHRQTIFHVAMALSNQVIVHGEDQCAAVHSLGALDQPLQELAIAQHGNLKPERRLRMPADIFNRTHAADGQAVGNAKTLSRARCKNLPVRS